jgi:mono/diheme cytochrome c family protein
MSLGHVFSSVAVAGVLLIGYAAHAQEAVLGKNEFEARCSVCHGVTGAGKPKNLRVLAKENGGIFPFDEVRAAIDGRRRVIAHGSSEMPIWGDYLMAEALEGRFIRPNDARLVVEARISALTQYIHSLQAD